MLLLKKKVLSSFASHGNYLVVYRIKPFETE